MSQLVTSVVDMSAWTKNATLVQENGVYLVTGEGIFDVMMETVNKHLQSQYKSKQLTGENYASAYVQLTQAVLGASVNILLQKPIADKQVESEIAKAALYKRQAKGFDDNAKQQLLKTSLDAWAVAFTVAKDDTLGIVPDTVTSKVIDSMMKDALSYSDLGGEHTPAANNGVDLKTDAFSGDFN